MYTGHLSSHKYFLIITTFLLNPPQIEQQQQQQANCPTTQMQSLLRIWLSSENNYAWQNRNKWEENMFELLGFWTLSHRPVF
jgi:hypothetical protein